MALPAATGTALGLRALRASGFKFGAALGFRGLWVWAV